MKITAQRLRNLTTGRLHTNMDDVCYDMAQIMGCKHFSAERYDVARKSILPWLKGKVTDARFWDKSYDATHAGEYSLPEPTEDERSRMWLDFRLRKHLLGELGEEAKKREMTLVKTIIPQRAILLRPETPREFHRRKVVEDWMHLYDVPDELVDNELCWRAVRHDVRAFQAVPQRFQSRSMCLHVAEVEGILIRSMPYARTLHYETCLTAIKNNGELKYVPKKHRTKEICEYAIERGKWDKNRDQLAYVPEHIKTYDFCLRAVKNGWYNLKHVPDKFRTFEMCSTAIKESKAAWQFAWKIYRIE